MLSERNIFHFECWEIKDFRQQIAVRSWIIGNPSGVAQANGLEFTALRMLFGAPLSPP